MNLSQINPVLSENMGWDTESAQNEEMVTFVKRAVVFSEVTLPKSEYLKMLNDDEYYWEEIEPQMVTDDVMKDYGNDFNKYAIFEGDISSMTDDVIGMCDFEWEDFMSRNSKVQKVEFDL
jgi:hypothetical protein